jgi:hypothetical protein
VPGRSVGGFPALDLEWSLELAYCHCLSDTIWRPGVLPMAGADYGKFGLSRITR